MPLTPTAAISEAEAFDSVNCRVRCEVSIARAKGARSYVALAHPLVLCYSADDQKTALK